MTTQREAIEKALMHLAYGGGVHKAQEILRAALAEQPQPVAWLFVLDGCRQVMLDEDADEAIRHHGIPLYRHPPAALAETPKPDKTEQGRAASRILGENVSALVGGGVPFLNALDATLKTYDHPPAAKLTDEEILAANMTQNGWPYVAANRQQVLAFARAVLRKAGVE